MIFTYLCRGYLYLDNPSSRQIVKWWTPQRIHDKLWSLHGVEQYTRARVMLEEEATFGLLQPHPRTLFLLQNTSGHIYLVGCLWSGPARSEGMHQLQEWFAEHDVALSPTRLLKSDQEVWEEASHDL